VRRGRLLILRRRLLILWRRLLILLRRRRLLVLFLLFVRPAVCLAAGDAIRHCRRRTGPDPGAGNAANKPWHVLLLAPLWSVLTRFGRVERCQDGLDRQTLSGDKLSATASHGPRE